MHVLHDNIQDINCVFKPEISHGNVTFKNSLRTVCIYVVSMLGLLKRSSVAYK